MSSEGYEASVGGIRQPDFDQKSTLYLLLDPFRFPSSSLRSYFSFHLSFFIQGGSSSELEREPEANVTPREQGDEGGEGPGEGSLSENEDGSSSSKEDDGEEGGDGGDDGDDAEDRTISSSSEGGEGE